MGNNPYRREGYFGGSICPKKEGVFYLYVEEKA